MKVEIFGFEGYNCPFCVNAKRLCEAKKYEYTYTPVNNGVGEDGRPIKDEALIAEIEKRAGAPIRTMPQIFVNNKYIGGFEQFRAQAVKGFK